MRLIRGFAIAAIALLGGVATAQANGHFWTAQGLYDGLYGIQQPTIQIPGYQSPYTVYPGSGSYYQQPRLPWPWNQLFSGTFNPYSQNKAIPNPQPINGCAAVRCNANSYCIETRQGPRCQPLQQQPITTCAQVLCSAGNRCEQRGRQAVCVPNQVTNPLLTNPLPTVCTREYRPVCAQPRTFNCVTTPCIAPRRTFSNACVARSQGYRVLRQGACR